MDHGLYLNKKDKKWRVRVPNQGEVIFHPDCFDAAISERDRLCKIEGLDPYKYKLSSKGGRLGRPSPVKKHVDLPFGVTRAIEKRKNAKYHYYVALVNTRFQKKFNHGIYRTEEKALKMAVSWANAFKDFI